MSHITKDFPGTRALDDVSFDLYAGEIHCLVGENGAGKSTLIKILSGAEKPDQGEIILFGKTYRHLTTKQAIDLKIATIYQDVDLVDSLTVADNIFLGVELRDRLGVVDTKKQEEIAQDIMRRLNIHIDPRLLVEELSPAQKQILQLIKALHRDARILIMDEPTSSLGIEETRALLELVRTLSSQGIGIIYISHYLQEVTQIGDRITVLKDGKTVACYRKSEFTIEQLIRDMVGREASLFYRKDPVPIGEVGLRVENYSGKSLVKNVSFEVRHGEIFGLGGMVGSGRTELVNLIFGIDRRDSGELYLDGQRITPNSPRQAIRHRMCLITEDRKGSGIFPFRSVKENISIARNEQENKVALRLSAERQRVEKIIKALKIQLASIEQDINSLSGGNQQKSILGRWLLNEADVFIFDEPTKGVDIGSKEEIYRIMTDLCRQQKCIIMVSSDMPELISMSDRIGVMRDGRLIAIVNAREISEEELLRIYLGYYVEEKSNGRYVEYVSQ
ncbi:MAG: sugar ABC transporter ATP-binding protein [Anaerolineales bacterium]|nr:sugar ABC transporter ATP-binding protein [Anaerolineales bacterium]MDW8161537.1 sugar ABC transporter ATP-binding protein [Anaerolineales bacterium]